MVVAPASATDRPLRAPHVPITFDQAPGNPKSPAQHAKALELLSTAKAALNTVLAAPPAERCATFKKIFVVERLADKCSVSKDIKALRLSRVFLTVDSNDETDAPAVYDVQFIFKEANSRQEYLATIFVREPGSTLRVKHPSNIPTLINIPDAN
jgi:hypothetical protein